MIQKAFPVTTRSWPSDRHDYLKKFVLLSPFRARLHFFRAQKLLSRTSHIVENSYHSDQLYIQEDRFQQTAFTLTILTNLVK